MPCTAVAYIYQNSTHTRAHARAHINTHTASDGGHVWQGAPAVLMPQPLGVHFSNFVISFPYTVPKPFVKARIHFVVLIVHPVLSVYKTAPIDGAAGRGGAPPAVLQS